MGRTVLFMNTTTAPTPTQAASSSTSTAKTYAGSCHCGDVRFEARLDLQAGVSKCNCTICKKLNFLSARVKPGDMKILVGEGVLGEYSFNTKSVLRFFCRRCGVHLFAHANIPQAGGEYYGVNVHCLEGADPVGVRIKYYDGLHDNWFGADPPAFA
jgi:hypothetical protein